MTTDNQAGIGRGMMRYARGVRKEFKRAQGARAKFAVGASGIAEVLWHCYKNQLKIY